MWWVIPPFKLRPLVQRLYVSLHRENLLAWISCEFYAWKRDEKQGSFKPVFFLQRWYEFWLNLLISSGELYHLVRIVNFHRIPYPESTFRSSHKTFSHNYTQQVNTLLKTVWNTIPHITQWPPGYCKKNSKFPSLDKWTSFQW